MMNKDQESDCDWLNTFTEENSLQFIRRSQLQHSALLTIQILNNYTLTEIADNVNT